MRAEAVVDGCCVNNASMARGETLTLFGNIVGESAVDDMFILLIVVDGKVAHVDSDALAKVVHDVHVEAIVSVGDVTVVRSWVGWIVHVDTDYARQGGRLFVGSEFYIDVPTAAVEMTLGMIIDVDVARRFELGERR